MSWLVDEATQLGGSLDPKETTVAMVNIWEVAGADYHNARNLDFFFDDLKSAQAFKKKNSHPPECPWLVELDKEHLKELMASRLTEKENG